MPSEGSIVGADQTIEEVNRELAEAREQQAATAKILSVISSSPTDLQGVFAEILREVPPGRQLEYAHQGRHGVGPVDRPRDRRDAWRAHLGRVDEGSTFRMALPVRAALPAGAA